VPQRIQNDRVPPNIQNDRVPQRTSPENFHILKMRTHFEEELHFENESIFFEK
jgi:hypothetical protein